jgi:hypothetical protein
VEAEPPVRSVEETVGAGGRRRTRGTYLVEPLDPATTMVRVSVAPIELPRSERPLLPVSRAWLRRQNAPAMERLREQLEAQPSRAAA